LQKKLFRASQTPRSSRIDEPLTVSYGSDKLKPAFRRIPRHVKSITYYMATFLIPRLSTRRYKSTVIRSYSITLISSALQAWYMTGCGVDIAVGLTMSPYPLSARQTRQLCIIGGHLHSCKSEPKNTSINHKAASTTRLLHRFKKQTGPLIYC